MQQKLQIDVFSRKSQDVIDGFGTAHRLSVMVIYNLSMDK